MKNKFYTIILTSLALNLSSVSAKENTLYADTEKKPFNTGFSFGINAGYHMGKLYQDDDDSVKINQNNQFLEDFINKHKTIEDHSPFIGLHIDYNYPLNKTNFIGVGIEANYLPTKKWTTYNKESSPISPLTLNIDALNHKEYSFYFSVRTGVLLTDSLSMDISMAIVSSSFLQEIRFSARNTNLNISANKDFSERHTRIGFAPGIGITTAIAKNVSTGINYRYEIYPYEENHEKIDSHNFFIKLSYHM